MNTPMYAILVILILVLIWLIAANIRIVPQAQAFG